MIDAERKSKLKKVLSDAVPMLCLSGLGIYHSEIAVEALIGITINNEEVVLISFNELMTADGGTISHSWRQLNSSNGNCHESHDPKGHVTSVASIDLSNKKMKTSVIVNDDVEEGDAMSSSDGTDGIGEPCFVERTKCDVADTGDQSLRSKFSSKRCQRRNRVSLRTSVQEKQQSTSNKRAFEKSGLSRVDSSQGAALSQNSAGWSPIVKVKPNDNENCIFVKVESSDDDYKLGYIMDISKLGCSYASSSSSSPSSSKKQQQRHAALENCDLLGDTKYSANAAGQRHLQARRSRFQEFDQFAPLHINRNMPIVEFQADQSDASALEPGGTFLPFPFDQHHPEPIPPTASQFAPKKRCRVCYAKKVRKEVRFCCSACPDLPGLCLGPCFYEYHQVFLTPRLLQEGVISENSGGSMQDRHGSVKCSQS